MRISAFLIMASLFSFLLGGCASRKDKVLYEGVYKGQKYVVKSHETHTYNGSRTDWRVQLGNLPELPINVTMKLGTPISLDGALSTDWGAPFSDEIFGQNERAYFGATPAYSSLGDDYSKTQQIQHDETMLYVHEEIQSDQYRQYAAMMKADWAKVDKALVTNSNDGFPRIVGVVHGSRQLFVRHFRGTIKGVSHVLRIDPDGYVNLHLDDSVTDDNRMRHCKVQMPGKVIPLRKIYGWNEYKSSKAEIARFKDAQGKTPEAYFKLQD